MIHNDWVTQFYQDPCQKYLHQFSRRLYEKEDGDRMYCVYYPKGLVFKVSRLPPMRHISDQVIQKVFAMKWTMNLEQEQTTGVTF